MKFYKRENLENYNYHNETEIEIKASSKLNWINDKPL